MHQLRSFRHQLTDLHAWNRRCNRPVRSTESRVWFRIPAFKLTHASIQPKQQNLLLILLEFLTDYWPDDPTERAESKSGSRTANGLQHSPTRNTMLSRITGLRIHDASFSDV
jgi:hypothetical protein